MRAAHVAVVGLGGVGSWTVEALARSGVAALTLVDLDHVAESNVNRQVQALGSTLGMAKAEALAARIADIHPGCVVAAVEEFVDEANWPGLLPGAPTSSSTPATTCAPRRCSRPGRAPAATPLVSVGAAGGKRAAERVEVDDLADVTHDPMLAALRQRLRKHHGAPRAGAIGVCCVFSREPVAMPARRRLRRRRQPQLPRLRLERRRDGDLRHGRRGARPRARRGPRRPGRARPPAYNHGLGGLLAQLVEQRTFNP